ncbi:unnamed protein product [Alopecurus aequalis]
MGLTLDMAARASSSDGPVVYVKSTASGSHLLQIDGYSIAKHAPNGTSLKSCPFTVGGYPWIIHLFPNGDIPESAGFISVFIGLHGYCHRRRCVRLHVEFSFVDEVEKQDPAHVRTKQVLKLISNYGVGYRRFIAREALENSKHLQGDRFTVRCDFLVTGYVDIPFGDPVRRSRTRACAACNHRPMKTGMLPLIHACLCDVCNDASRNDPTAKQCEACHGAYEGRFLQ